MNIGDKVYFDRDYVVEFVPDLLKTARLIQTANEDKSRSDFDFLKLLLTEPSTVYVAYDSRLMHLPLWLSTWMDTGQSLRLSGHSSTFNLYAKNYQAGDVTLGGNTYGGSMYVVAVQSVKVTAPVEPPPLPTPEARPDGPWKISSNARYRVVLDLDDVGPGEVPMEVEFLVRPKGVV